MKKTLIILMVLICMSSLFARGAKEAAEMKEPSTHIIVDHQGYEVEVPKKIERIAFYGIYPLPSVVTIFFNNADKIVAMGKPSLTAAQNGLLGQLYPEILNVDTAPVTGQIHIEELLKKNPDIVFFFQGSEAAITRKILTDAGLPAIGVNTNKWGYNCIETLDNWISLLAELFPEDSDKVQIARTYSHRIYNEIQSRVKDIPDEERARVFVLFQYSPATMLTSGNQFYGQWWCDAVGAINVANEIDKDNQVPATMEQVYSWNPEIIMITNFTSAQPETLYTNAVGNDDWSAIKAVQDRRVYKTPLGMYRSYTPGVDVPITLSWWAKTIYPELFEDFNPIEIAKDYYKTVFGVELTDAQAASIFAPTSEAAGGF